MEAGRSSETPGAWAFLGALLLFGLLLRGMVAYLTVHYFDLSYYVDWSAGAASDLFGAYENLPNLDYPPLFLFLLQLTGKVLALPGADFPPYRMLALKGWQMAFDLLLIPLIYLALRRSHRLAALGAAALWAVNPTGILNSSYWGQTDAIMMALLVLAFWQLDAGRPAVASAAMALGCLMKFQTLYFAPVFALALLGVRPLKRLALSVGAGAAALLAVLLPFMVRSGVGLPWRIYFGGLERYKSASLNAFNFYAARGLNYKSADLPVLGAVPAETFSAVALALALGLLVLFWFTAGEKSVWLLGFWFMQTVFLFTTRMHERYQFPVLILGLAACVVHKSRGLFGCHLALVVMTFLNHFLMIQELLAKDKTAAWLPHYQPIAAALGWVNLALYAWSFVEVLRVLYRGGFPAFRRPGREPPPSVA